MAAESQLVRVRDVDARLRVDLRYARPDNFTGAILYPIAEAYLLRSTTEKLSRAQDQLERRGMGLLVWDAYRPPSAQAALWARCPDPRFVAPPSRGSRHTRGVAVDVTLVDAAGVEVEMPSGFDEFTDRAHRGWLGANVAARRHCDWLTDAMVSAGFAPISSEWWHYDDTAWRDFPLLSIEFPEEVTGERRAR
ncbi:MAG: M15 family metallopeptidase [Verrucomicrobiales bacterium]|nr:M15 family metallopeptidase [Verrucomicrobiales bacterium]